MANAPVIKHSFGVRLPLNAIFVIYWRLKKQKIVDDEIIFAQG
jgi:hypothetical protein